MNQPFPIDPAVVYTTEQAANALNTQPRTLKVWRLKGTGPAFIRLGGRMVRYKGDQLLKFIEQRTFRSTSEETRSEA